MKRAAAVLPFMILAVAVSSVYSQATRSLSSLGRRMDEISRTADKTSRDEMNREMRGKQPTQEDVKRAALKNAEIREDLESLQTVYNRIVTKIQSREAVFGSFAVETAENVHKRFSRLKSNIVFPEKTKADKAAADSALPVRESLVVLCKKIYSFITSPMFENPGVLDVEASMKTRDTLDEIGRIADRLRHTERGL